MKNWEYHTVCRVPQSNRKIVEREENDTSLNHKDITDHFPELVKALQ
jgi:hypothetical protein